MTSSWRHFKILGSKNLKFGRTEHRLLALQISKLFVVWIKFYGRGMDLPPQCYNEIKKSQLLVGLTSYLRHNRKQWKTTDIIRMRQMINNSKALTSSFPKCLRDFFERYEELNVIFSIVQLWSCYKTQDSNVENITSN